MAAGYYNFIIEQGSTLDYRVQYKDANNAPIDLTDYHAKMQIRNAPGGGTLYMTLSSSLKTCGTGINMTPTSASIVLPKSSGSFSIYLSAASSSLLNFDKAHYDLELISGSGACAQVIRVLQGRIKLSKEVTK